ncbi:MAG: sugar phosphate isomerase/epimerase [Armatimonadota bacterium]|nr:MAG: sugar phosphate isomerase/epimerase [Armatimonadota bacterium]
MRFGCSVGPELIEAAAEAEYDYVELPVETVQPERPEAEFRRVQEDFAGASVRPEAWNCFPSAELKVCGSSLDWPRLARYVNTALRRVAALGGSVVVFDCSGSRSIPEDFEPRGARAQISDFLRLCAATIHTHGLILGIKPLDAAQSSLISSLPEAVAFARLAGAREVGVLADCGQLAAGSHSPFDVTDAGLWLAHAHIGVANLSPEAQARDLTHDFVEALRLADYDGRISVEGDWTDPDRELKTSLEVLRQLWETD